MYWNLLALCFMIISQCRQISINLSCPRLESNLVLISQSFLFISVFSLYVHRLLFHYISWRLSIHQQAKSNQLKSISRLFLLTTTNSGSWVLCTMIMLLKVFKKRCSTTLHDACWASQNNTQVWNSHHVPRSTLCSACWCR
jgi:predicted permease